MFDPNQIKKDFPILNQKVGDFPLTYLDNSATSQKTIQVIDAISHYYSHDNANVHRGIHYLSDQATKAWEESRKVVAQFFGAQVDELIVTRNATEAINGVAYGWGLDHLAEGDVILTTIMEHHANVVPWQEICKRTGARLEFVKVTEDGRLDLEDLKRKLSFYAPMTIGASQDREAKSQKVKLVAFTHVSNTLGTVNPIDKIVEIINSTLSTVDRPLILVDGAQSAPHIKINFDQMGVDFYAFSGHKMLGPMGVGGLLVRRSLLESGEMKPWLFGGGMIASVMPEKTAFNPDLAERFTAGTPDVASLVGLASACNYLDKLRMEDVERHDRELVAYALDQLSQIDNVQIVGPSSERLGSVAFVHKLAHAHDVAQILDSVGVAVRSGHHCCMPLHMKFGWVATVRASFQVYNTKEDIDQLIVGLEKVGKVFQ